MTRRALLSLLVASATSIATACTRGQRDRCAFCGMRIDPASAWRADLVNGDVTTHFDTPRCALLAWRSGKTPARSLRVQEFYDRAWRDGSELRFAVGSDVIGPMGADLVPLDPSRVAKFGADHAAADTLTLDAITTATLASIR
jgi:copper chaperone NosL